MSDLDTRPVGRPCHACSHPRRSELEADILSGDRSISSISSEYELSIAGTRRHAGRHMNFTPAQVAQAGLGPTDIAARMLDLAGRLEDLFEDAEERRSPADAARVGAVLDRVYRGLMDRGVKPDLVDKSRGLELDVKILTTALRAHPELAEEAARQYESHDYLSAAKRVRSLFSETKEVTA